MVRRAGGPSLGVPHKVPPNIADSACFGLGGGASCAKVTYLAVQDPESMDVSTAGGRSSREDAKFQYDDMKRSASVQSSQPLRKRTEACPTLSVST